MKLRSFIVYIFIPTVIFLMLSIRAVSTELPVVSPTEKIVIESADYMKYDKKNNVTTLSGNVSFSYMDFSVSAQEVILNEKTKTAFAKNDVKLSTPSGVFEGESMLYEYSKERFEILNGSGSTTADDVKGHIFFSGNIIKGNRNKIKIIKARFTTCEKECPVEYHMRARDVSIFPDKKVIARDLYIHMGGTRTFYFPVYVVSLKQNRHYMPDFGYSKEEGFYVNMYYPYLTRNALLGWLLFDYTTKKGERFGAEHEYISKRLGGKGYNYFKTNREKDTGNSSNNVMINQELKIGAKTTGSFSYNRESTYNEFRLGSRINENRIKLDMKRVVYEMKPAPSGPSQGKQLRTTSLLYNQVTKNQATSKSDTKTYTITRNENIYHTKDLITKYSYNFKSIDYYNKEKNLDGNFNLNTNWNQDLFSLSMKAQKTFDYDGDKYPDDQMLNVLWPQITLNVKDKLYKKIIPDNILPISRMNFIHERKRQGKRSDSEALRTSSLFLSMTKILFEKSRKLDFRIQQDYKQNLYSTQDANYVMTNITNLSYSYNKPTKLSFTFNSTKDSGGSPSINTRQGENINLKSTFSIIKPKTAFKLNTTYTYTIKKPDSRYSPLIIDYKRSLTNNSDLNLNTKFDPNYDRWNPMTTVFNISRKNTDYSISGTWDIEDFDLSTASFTTHHTRNNGWELKFIGKYEHKSKYSPLREIIITKHRCCTKIEMKYNERNDEFQLQYIIRAFPKKTFGFTQSTQGFEIDDSAWSEESQSQEKYK